MEKVKLRVTIGWVRMNYGSFKYAVLILLWSVFNWGCRDKHRSAPLHRLIQPNYESVQVNVSSDTVSFALDENVYNVIESVNLFSDNGIEYLSFFDERSGSVIIYDFYSKALVKKILLKDCLPGSKLYKASAFTCNFDSIFVNNNTELYLIDSSGFIKKSIDFLEKPPFAWATFNNTNPAIVKDSHLYTLVRPYVEETSLNALKEWKVLYDFDLNKSSAVLHYNLPIVYQEELYGSHYLDYSYCYNDQGRFVFSFPADSNIYETDLAGYHISYLGKSRTQTRPISPVKKKVLLEDGGVKSYLLSDSYGAIYYDSNKKRYLRVAKSKLSVADYNAKKKRKKQSLIVFDEDFKIIGETEISPEFSLSTILFSRNGDIYARINPNNEYNLQFVKLMYEEKHYDSKQLSKQ